jgi:transposase
MIGLPAGVKVFLACGATDMRKGLDSLAVQVQTILQQDPFSGHVFVFRGRRGDLIKALYWDTQGLCKPCSRNLFKGGRLSASDRRQCRCPAGAGAMDGDAPWRHRTQSR